MARVGWSVPLGGPFRVSGNLGCFGGLVQLFAVLIVLAFPVLLILALFALVYTYWVQIVIVVGSIIALVFVIKMAAWWKDGLKPQPPEVILPSVTRKPPEPPAHTNRLPPDYWVAKPTPQDKQDKPWLTPGPYAKKQDTHHDRVEPE